jgi:hypothetical protein
VGRYHCARFQLKFANRDGIKIRNATYAKDGQGIDFAGIADNSIFALHIWGQRGNLLIYWMVHCRYRAERSHFLKRLLSAGVEASAISLSRPALQAPRDWLCAPK